MKKLFWISILICIKAHAIPTVHVEKGCKCFECPYFQKGQKVGIWKANSAIPLYQSPTNRKIVANVKPQEKAVAISGEVRTTPGELQVVFARKKYRPGDIVYVLLEDADAGYKVWHNGLEDIEDLSPMVSETQPCKVPSEKCWAKVVKPLSSEWWVELETRGKIRGWTNAVDSFDFDRSACF